MNEMDRIRFNLGWYLLQVARVVAWCPRPRRHHHRVFARAAGTCSTKPLASAACRRRSSRHRDESLDGYPSAARSAAWRYRSCAAVSSTSAIADVAAVSAASTRAASTASRAAAAVLVAEVSANLDDSSAALAAAAVACEAVAASSAAAAAVSAASRPRRATAAERSAWRHCSSEPAVVIVSSLSVMASPQGKTSR